METIVNALTSEFEKLNGRFKTVSIEHVEELKEEIIHWKQKGEIQEQFYKQNYGLFEFEKPKMLPNAQFIIIIAIPQGTTLLDWRLYGESHEVVLPPTYVYTGIRTSCMDILSRVFHKAGYSFTQAVLPLKLLAVRSGLGTYGQNNLCYIGGMGSFHRLEAFYTDYVFPTDDWQGKELLERCMKCSLCAQACPTQCITMKRFLIHAERCLTSYNENEGVFPEWIDPRSHNALVGCMKCQQVCPENRAVIQLKERGVTFSEEETSMILRETPEKRLPQALSSKLRRLNIDEYYSLLPRNLAVLMNKY